MERIFVALYMALIAPWIFLQATVEVVGNRGKKRIALYTMTCMACYLRYAIKYDWSVDGNVVYPIMDWAQNVAVE